MAVINVNNTKVDVDISDELSEYTWRRSRWTDEKLIACSPFRDDNAPSFFVDLVTGGWADSGAYDDRYAKGNFVKLLGYLRGTNEEEASDYLIDKYGALYEIKPDEPIRIKPPVINTPPKELALTRTVTKATSPYLISRGIAPDIQAEYGIGYNDNNKGYTAFPWLYHDTGEIANVKYRSTRGKRFFYEPDAKPVTELIYGLWQAKGVSDVIICEAEIDVLSWAMAGYYAIAVGGAHISRKQVEIIKREGYFRVYLGGDNDSQGEKFNRQLAKEFRGYADLHKIDYREEKDANDVLMRHGVGELVNIIENAVSVTTIKIRL